MAAILNDLDILLQAASPRVLPVTFGTGDTFDGDVTGTIDGFPATDVATGIADGQTAFTDTVDFRISVPPSNNP